MVHKLNIQFPICNSCPERAPHIGKHCFPLCWRCLSTIIGIFIFTIYLIVYKVNQCIDTLIITVFLCLPCAIDVFIQRYTPYVSTNFRRFLTGFLAGIGGRIFVFQMLAM